MKATAASAIWAQQYECSSTRICSRHTAWEEIQPTYASSNSSEVQVRRTTERI